MVRTADTDTQARRLAYLEQLQRVLPPSPAWLAWLEQTGELPPDFAALSSIATLPDPLRHTGAEGRMVENAADWRVRREELIDLFQHWVLGRVPPPPEQIDSVVLDE